jgi:choline dehydrogenase
VSYNQSRTWKNLTFTSAGVVDSQLRVYDTANIRIVDASIMPLQVSAHLSSTLYGVAEKAADLIKAGQ